MTLEGPESTNNEKVLDDKLVEERVETEQKIETIQGGLEMIANDPLEATSLVYSIPVMDEWKNGSLLRTLHALFSQHQDQDEAFEIEPIINIGPYLHYLSEIDPQTYKPIFDESGHLVLKPKAEQEDKTITHAREALEEAKETRRHLEKMVNIQKLAREAPTNEEAKRKLQEELDNIPDPLEKELCTMIAEKAESISLAVIDATTTLFNDSPYQKANIGSIRSLGADMIMGRFPEKNMAISLYDADTVPENNNHTREIQKLFRDFPDLKYYFTGMAYHQGGAGSTEYFTTSPEYQLLHTSGYNNAAKHGSPQIVFTTEAYKKIEEISSWTNTGYFGSEDFDTAQRLIYHFGDMQEGFLHDAYAEGHFPPTSLTGDRQTFGREGGNFDSISRDSLKTAGETVGLDVTYSFRLQHMFDFYSKRHPEKKQFAEEILEKARPHFLKQQKVQQRFNQKVARSFLSALDSGAVALEDEKLIIDEEKILEMGTGTALLHYVRANKPIIESVLKSPEDREYLAYMLGDSSQVPESLTPFQSALREYLGDVEPIPKLKKEDVITIIDADPTKKWSFHPEKVVDNRNRLSKVSLLHSMVAELLALGSAITTGFEVIDMEHKVGVNDKDWPKDRSTQTIEKRLSSQEERMNYLKEKVPGLAESPEKESILSKIDFASFPLFRLWKYLKKYKKS